MEYYQRIRNIREDFDVKQYQFAKMIGVLPKTYNLYENGVRTMPYPVLSKVLMKLHLSLDYVLELSERKRYSKLNEINTYSLAENIRHYRKEMELSQTEMAALLNCNQQTLSEYERGNLTIPLQTLKKFCQITEVSADTIAGRTDKIRKFERTPNL